MCSTKLAHNINVYGVLLSGITACPAKANVLDGVTMVIATGVIYVYVGQFLSISFFLLNLRKQPSDKLKERLLTQLTVQIRNITREANILSVNTMLCIFLKGKL